MSRSIIIIVMLTGVLLFLGSCAPFGYIIYQEILKSPVDSQVLPAGGTTHAARFQASPGSLARFTLEAQISTTSVQEDSESIDGKYIARFRFPLRYSISDASGHIIGGGKEQLAWKDGSDISKSNTNVGSTGGTLTASTSLDKFSVPADGNISIDLELGQDTSYGATYASPTLHLYEGLLDNTWYVVAGIVMLISGFALSLIALTVLIIRSARLNEDDGDSLDRLSDNHDVNQEAMIIQLSALSGYIVPFGSVILPVVLWLIWRNKDPYLDKMGGEAVNFQLTMVIYYIVSFILCLVLIGFLLIFAAMIFHLAYIIIGAMHCAKGNDFRYPMSIRFFR